MSATDVEAGITAPGADVEALAPAREACIHHRFRAQVARTPDAVAVVSGGESLTYAELDARADALACRLAAAGVGPETRVGICLERSTGMVAAMLAVLKAGGAYLPLDPAYPPERLAYMLEDSGARVLVTQDSLRGLLPAEGLTVVPADGDPFDAPEAEGLLPAVSAQNAAYVIYTSGSTGRPKGVVVTHANAVSFFAAMDERVGGTIPGCWLAVTRIGFDIHVLELLWTLTRGFRVVVHPDASREDGDGGVAAQLARHGVTHLQCTPSLAGMLIAEAGVEALAGLERLFLGGEVLPPPLAARVRTVLPGGLVNLYGPTEATVWAASHPVNGDAAGVPIGRALPNARLHVLDEDLRALPGGAAGELFIGGAGVARGYLGRPALTAERFVPDPFGGEPGARLYRTGDRGRVREDGALEYMGRLDDQVKIRGFRIELGEVEAALRDHPEVGAAAVAVRPSGTGEDRLVGYVVGRDGARPTGAVLRSELARRLPDYMVPALFVPLDALPLGPSGKVDRRALPAPPERPDDLETPFVAPRTETEAAVSAVWAEVLGLGQVGVEDDVFALGAHSLAVTQVASRVRARLGVDLPFGELFAARTAAALAAAVERRRAASAGKPPAPALAPAPEGARLPLSFSQERVWFLTRLVPGTLSYNFAAGITFRGELDPEALRRAVQEIIRRHEVFRTTFPEHDGRPYQQVHPPFAVDLGLTDLSGLDPAARTEEERRIQREMFFTPFDLEQLPLLRWRLLRRAANEHLLVYMEHHVVHDGWSFNVFLRELLTLYTAFSQGRPSPLPECALQFGDYAYGQRAWMESDDARAQLAFWRERLAGSSTLLELPLDRPRPAEQRFRGAAPRHELPAELYGRLRAAARREGVTLFAVMMAAFDVLLSRWSGQRDLNVGTGIANRRLGETEGMLGMFVNNVVVRARLDDDPSFGELARRVHAGVLDAADHQELPFDALVDALRPERSLSHNPLFQAMFSFHDSPIPDLRLPGLTVEVEPVLSNGTAKFDINVICIPRAEQRVGQGRPGDGDGITVIWEYSTDLFEPATMEAMVRQYRALLEAAAQAPETPVSRLPLWAPGERDAVLAPGLSSPPAPAPDTVHGRFARVAAERRDAVALVAGDLSLTYGELDARAADVARRLAGIAPEARVGICLERSPALVAALLGVLRAGGAYVPLDPAYPADRLAFMVADAGVSVLVTESRLRGALPAAEGVRVLLLDGEDEADGDVPARGGAIAADAGSLAYVMYTSGSTGTPKGAAVEHRGIVRLVCGADYVRLGPDEVVLHAAPASFDASTLEVWGALLNGGRLVLAPAGALSLAELGATIVRGGVTTLWLTAGLFQAMADERLEDLAGVRQLLAGGDVLPVQAVRRVRERFPQLRVINGYGPTENTTFTCCHTVPEDWDGGAIPVGRPIAGTRVYLLDPALQPVPAGVPGELYAGGDGVARGYPGRPALTAERFVPDPFGAPGARMYRTGDRARWRADGTVEFLGRLDGQVKIRGFRIEVGEVEAALRRSPGVGECVVVAREDAPGEKRLVAYVVGEADAEALRARLRQALPEYMIPAAFVALDALPLTPNGKVDRKALPAPDQGPAEERYVAPRTPVEEVLGGIWAQVLRLERVGVHDSFFALGGHSLLAMRVLSRVREVFGVELPVRAVFEGPTVAQAARWVEDARRGALPPCPPVARVEHAAPPPLSFAQERLWFLDRLRPGSAYYNVPVALRLQGALDAPALERALGELVRRHEALRTVFRETEGGPVQVIVPFAELVLEVDELAALDADEREAEAARLTAREVARPFDLAAGPLFRARLLRLDAADHVLLLTIHHAATDEWSMGVLFRELAALYAAGRDGGASPLAEPPVRYADYAVWQREQLRGEALERELAWWRERLAGAPELLALPADRPRPAAQTHRGAREAVELPLELRQRLEALGRAEGATLYMVLLAAFQVLLGRYAGSDDVVVGSPIAGRARPEVEEVVGFFANTLVLRADLSGDPGFRQVLRRVREMALGAYEHQDLPFERLVEELRPERSLSHSPLFQVMFVQESDPAPYGLPGVRARRMEVHGGTSKFDLTLHTAPHPDGLRATLEYSTDLFERGTARRMLGHLRRLLEQVAEDDDRPLSALELAGEAERRRVVEEWNRTDAEVPSTRCIHHLFEEQAARTPNAVALVFEDQALTYRTLNERANRLARRLRRLGVGPETRVGLCLERSLEMVVALLAVLKAGGAYVPLDPGYPAERLELMLADSGVPVLLTQERLRGALPASTGVAVVSLDAPETVAGSAGESAENLEDGAGPENLAYVIYTSGSTGRPKGVMNAHAGVVNRLCWMQAEYGLRPDDVVLQKTPFSFDVSVWEFFWPLQQGACLVLARPDGHRDPLYLQSVIERRGVTTLHFVPSMLQAFVETADPGRLTSLTRVICSGEALPPALVERFHARFPSSAALHNLYGPTEAAVDVSHWACAREDGSGVVPIGRPVWNTRLYVLDGGMRPVPVGVPGELYIGGVQVARGYLDRPGLTAERFVPDPFASVLGARLYATGDRARWREDGALEYLGRGDQQVKIRGFRVEPGEVEAVLRRHPAVRDCAVAAREDVPGEVWLVAYVAGGADAETLRAHLRRSLPEHMVPAAFVALDALPLTPNGKLDRSALPAPEHGGAEERYAAPGTPVEEVLAGIWAEVLRLERVGVHDSFFELGGHSLLATRVATRVREAFGVELTVRAMFEAPSVAELAARVEALRRAERLPLPPLVPAERAGPPPLSFAQEGLWFIDRLAPESASYNLPVALRLEGALDVPALERALGEIVRRHQALRTVFAQADGGPVQVIVPFAGFALPVEDLSPLDPAERAAMAERRAAEEAARPFDLEAGPLFRATLLRLEGEAHLLLLTTHHVACDGWGVDVLLRELEALYGAYREGRASPLAEPPVQYADFAVWQREQLRGEALEGPLAWWTERLRGAPELLELPTDRPRPAVPSFRGGRVAVQLPDGLTERLRALGRREGATLYMVLLGAFQVVLGRHAGSDDVVVGSPVAGRTHREAEGLIGCFVNTLALRADLSGDPSFRALLRQVRETALGAYEHQEVPFERLVAELRPGRTLSHAPLVQVTFALQDAGGGEPALSGLAVRRVGAGDGTAKFDLSLTLEAGAGGVRGTLTYSADLFDRDTARRLAEQLERVLEQVADDAERPVSALALMGEEERALRVEGWRPRAVSAPEGSIHRRFEAVARRAPAAEAVACGEARLTYAELDARAGRVARRLRALGVGPESRVGLCLERSAETVVAVLGVLKAGGAYVPVDPAYPADRIAYVLRDSGVALVVAQDATRAAVPACDARVLTLDELLADAPGDDEAEVSAEVDPANAAYVIYTSGSTGRPKGVVVTHAGVLRLFDATDARFGFGADDAWTLFHSYAFDFSVWEIWGALLYGGRLVVVPFEVSRSPDEFHALLARERVTVLNQTPSAFRQLVRADEAAGGGLALRWVVFGGEALEPRSLLPWFDRHGDERPRLVNMYGITETTVHVTFRPLSRADAEAGGSMIGEPIPDLGVYLLDGRLEPVPPGVPGEIFVGGAGAARGYLGRPGLTAERFVPDPFSGEPGARMYRSGDRARGRADGDTEYLGRADQQVKVRGFRIEPGEIEAALLELPDVADAAVLARGEALGEKQLVAYVVLRPGAEGDPAAMRAALAGRLPDYMVPAAFMVLPGLPLTVNGKLDRRALPAPEAGRLLRPEYAAPASWPERLLQAVWEEVLGAERVGVLEDFFAAGGDSILAVQVVARLRNRGMAVTVRDLFQHPTIRGLAEAAVAAVAAGQVHADVPHHLADLPEHEWSRLRAVYGHALEDAYPATRMQAAMIAAYAADTARDGVYHPQQCLRITDPSFSPDALRHAIAQLVRRHAVLRTAFAVGSDGALLQVVRRDPDVPVHFRDLRALPADERERAAQAVIAEDLRTPFDPTAPAELLVRFVILRHEDGVADLLISAHHAIEDGWGNVHFLNTLFEAYADARDGLPVSAAPVVNTFREFVALEAEIVASDEARAFWRGRAGPAVPAWPARRAGGDGSPRECRLVRPAPPELTAALREAAARERVALKAMYLSPFLDVVAGLTGGEDACAGVVWNGRSERLSDPLTALGLFWNLVPVVRPSGGAADRVRAVHGELLRADPFGRYPLTEIMADHGGREPFFATFNFLQFRHWGGDNMVRGGRLEPVHVLDRFHLPFNLAVKLAPHREGGTLAVEYDARFFTPADAADALDGYLLRLGELAPPRRADVSGPIPGEPRSPLNRTS